MLNLHLQWGIDPGTFIMKKGVEILKSGSEYGVYGIIDVLDRFIHNVKHASQLNHEIGMPMPIEVADDMIRAQYALEFAVMQSRRFGVEIPDPKPGEHVDRTDSYKAWYEWWDTYIQRDMTSEQWGELNALLETGGDLSKFRPSGDWKPAVVSQEVTTAVRPRND